MEADVGRGVARVQPAAGVAADGLPMFVAMAVFNHLDDEMHAHYSTVSGAEMTNAVAQVIDLATFRKAHGNTADLLAAFPTSLPTTRV